VEDILSLRKEFKVEAGKAGNLSELQLLKVKYLGKKGLVTAKLKALASIPPDARPVYGKSINELKDFIEAEVARTESALKEKEHKKRTASEAIDVTLPGRFTPYGREHPINRVLSEITEIFASMGFETEEGPEVELDYYNFEALNIPKNHPARDMQDTFYISDDVVLRTHTSPVQIRVMEKRTPPLRIVAPGKVYRCDADICHTPMFHQVEGFMVDTDISFSDLKRSPGALHPQLLRT
jgi:phenylalanyl-tRNA synthetase alpha chain